jgi:hypothetical protein
MTNTLLFIIVITGAIVAALYFLFRFLLRLSQKPVMEISLLPVDNPKWSDSRRITHLIDAFQKNGFDLAGHYESYGKFHLFMSGFVKPSEQMAGVIYDHPIGGIWVNVYVHYADGGSLTVSNAAKGSELDHMPQQTKIYCKEGSVDELLAKILTEGKKEGRITITKEEFASNFEAQYQKEMKWRMERGGPTSLEVMRVANDMGKSLDSEKLQNKTRQLQKIWMKEKNKPVRIGSIPYEAVLPGEFQSPEAFRQRMEQKSAPIPQMNMPALPVYIVLITAISYWCYYGYRYNNAHRPVSFTDVIIFLSVILVLFVTIMSFREYYRRVRMCPFLKRIADLRPGAFLFISGTYPTLFYARDGWIGKVIFREGSKYQDASTSLEAITKHSGGWLLISRKNILSKVFGHSDKDNIQLPESDFSRKFTVSGTDGGFAEKMLNSNMPGEIMRLEEFKNPFVDIDGTSIKIEINGDLSSTRKETELRQFLEVAENIIEAVVQQS